MRIKLLSFFFCLLCGYSLIAQNIQISNSNSPNEPSIKMDPKNPKNIIAAANLNNYYISTDTGQTWTENTLSSSLGVWGDPVIDVDTSGNFYFFHLSNPPGGAGSWIDRIICQKTTDLGQIWTDGSFMGLNGTKAQDKEWSVVDRTNNNIYITWTEFDDYGSANPQDSSRILFSRSFDGGNSWSPAQKINRVSGDCVDSDNTVEGATPAIGPNGEIYVAWTGPRGIVFNKSFDMGNTWLTDPILVDSLASDWDFDIPGINRCNGLPVLKCDLSGGPNHGALYINWTDQRNGVDDTDVWLSISHDGGDNWSIPSKVNNDNSGRHQFLSWIDIDQSNGNLHFIYYDRRNFSDNRTNVFLASSEDGGQSFTNRIISESPFEPFSGVFFGDYTNITAHNNIVRPIWTRLENGVLSVWTDVSPFEAKEDTSTNLRPINEIESLQQFPNPTSSLAFVSFKLKGESKVSVTLFDLNGKKVYSVLDNENRGYGKYVIPINIEEAQLTPGTYPCILNVNGESKSLNPIVVK